MQSATPSASTEFVLFPFRSPLLWESRLISLPSGTEMFHFPEFAPPTIIGTPSEHSPDSYANAMFPSAGSPITLV